MQVHIRGPTTSVPAHRDPAAMRPPVFRDHLKVLDLGSRGWEGQATPVDWERVCVTRAKDNNELDTEGTDPQERALLPERPGRFPVTAGSGPSTSNLISGCSPKRC
jgi:hypothetical protein